jgi:hypothetical protein
MDNESIYTLTELADSLFHKDVESMDDWLVSLSTDELSTFYRMCQKKPENRTGQEEYEICRRSIVLYCREVGLTELGLNSEFMNKITGTFCVNVIVEALRRDGMVTTTGPLLIYKKTQIKLSEDYKKDED